jgi:hypothetical protein
MIQSAVHILTTVLVCGCEMCTLGANIHNEKRTKTQSPVPVYSEVHRVAVQDRTKGEGKKASCPCTRHNGV